MTGMGGEANRIHMGNGDLLLAWMPPLLLGTAGQDSPARGGRRSDVGGRMLTILDGL
jgi:hypothetical protein